MIETRKPFEMTLPEGVYELAHLFEKEGAQLFVVGGAVRDAVMGVPPKDYDLATDATPDSVVELLEQSRGWATDEVGRAFGVVRARGTYEGDCHEYEIATFRKDIGTGRRPDAVEFTTIEEDVKRRDLTVNALFYDIQRREVVDLVGGLEDINAKQVQTVGRPEDRFAEDRLRKLRAIRFAVKLGFDMHGDTYHSIQDDNNLSGVSFERIRDEFVKAIAGAKSPKRLMKLMDAFNMWPRVLPGLKASTCFDSSVSTRGIDSNTVPIVLALLLDQEDPETLGKRLNYLKYSADEIAQVTFLLRLRDLSAVTAPKLRKAFQQSKLAFEHLAYYVGARGLPARDVASAFFEYLYAEPYRGEPLMAQGFSGQALGQELQRLESELFSSMVGA